MKRKIFLFIKISLLLIIGICNVVYAKYVLNMEFKLEGLASKFYFDASVNKNEFILINNEAEIELTIKNNDGTNFNTINMNYEISLLNNEKFTLEVAGENVIENTVSKIMVGNELNSETIKLVVAAKENVSLNTNEIVTINVTSTYPYRKEYNFSIDLMKDEISPQIDLSVDKTEWTNQDVELTAVFQDNESGVVGYAWTDSETQPTSWQSVSQTTSQITKTITVSSNCTKYFWAKDAVGNVSSSSIIVDNIDKNAPSAPTISIIDIAITASGWQYTISAPGSSDSESKIAGYEYSLGSSSSLLTENTKLVTGTGDPNYTIKVRAKDNAGNYSSYSNAMVLNIKRLYIRQLYQALRGNGGGAESEISGWENSSATTAAQLAYGIFSSDESATVYTNVEREEMVQRLYKGILGRGVDSSGLTNNLNKMTSDNWFEVKDSILTQIVNSPEAQGIYSARGLPTGQI